MSASSLDRTLTGIRVRRSAAGERGFAATVELVGVHDLGMTELVYAALAPLRGDVLVDLRRCSSIDSATISVLIRCGRERAREGCALELIAPPRGSSAEQALRDACIGEFLPVQRELPEPEPVPLIGTDPGFARSVFDAPRYPPLHSVPGVRRRHACQSRRAPQGWRQRHG